MHRRRLEGGGRRRVKAAAATAEGMEGVRVVAMAVELAVVMAVAVMEVEKAVAVMGAAAKVVVAREACKPEDHNLRSLFRKRRMLGPLKLGFPQ